MFRISIKITLMSIKTLYYTHKGNLYEYKNIVFQQKNFHKGIESLLNELNRMAFSKDICLSFHGLLESPDNLAIYRF